MTFSKFGIVCHTSNGSVSFEVTSITKLEEATIRLSSNKKYRKPIVPGLSGSYYYQFDSLSTILDVIVSLTTRPEVNSNEFPNELLELAIRNEGYTVKRVPKNITLKSSNFEDYVFKTHEYIIEKASNERL